MALTLLDLEKEFPYVKEDKWFVGLWRKTA